jgi:alpha-galactosidase
LTTVDWREEDLRRRLERSRRLVSGEEPVALKASGEEGYRLIKALLGLGETVSNVNLPNRGQIANLPADAVVETNALFRRDEIAPVFAGNIPGNILPMVARHVHNQENTVEAALNRDRGLAFTAFMNDPLVTLDVADGEVLFNTMLDNTRSYLTLYSK